MSTQNLWFRAKIKKNEYPCKPQFYYIKVGCKGVFITRTCYHDVDNFDMKNCDIFLILLKHLFLLFQQISMYKSKTDKTDYPCKCKLGVQGDLKY